MTSKNWPLSSDEYLKSHGGLMVWHSDTETGTWIWELCSLFHYKVLSKQHEVHFHRVIIPWRRYGTRGTESLAKQGHLEVPNNDCFEIACVFPPSTYTLQKDDGGLHWGLYSISWSMWCLQIYFITKSRMCFTTAGKKSWKLSIGDMLTADQRSQCHGKFNAMANSSQKLLSQY